MTPSEVEMPAATAPPATLSGRWFAFGRSEITLRRLEVAAVVGPLLFLGLYYYLMLGPLHDTLHSWYGLLALFVLLAVAVTLFARTVFHAVRSMQEQIANLHMETVRANTRLRALHGAGLSISAETDAATVLKRLVALVAQLVEARYAVLATVNESGRVTGIHTSGLEAAGVEAIEASVDTNGLLAALLRGPTAALRVPDLSRDPLAARVPPGHPPLRSVIGTALVYRNRVVGALYAADPGAAHGASPIDSEILAMFASQAATVLRNARLYEELEALAIDRERMHLAREMHDGLAQVLSFVNIKAAAVEARLAREEPDEARRHLRELSKAARDVYADIREGIVALRVRGTAERSLADVLDEYVEEFRNFARLPVTLEWAIPRASLRLGPQGEVQLLRIVQEALTNVRRHAGAKRVCVTFDAEGTTLVVTIADDGRGFDPSRIERGEWPQFGLQAMRERAEAIGGALTISSGVGAGATVTARLPNAVLTTPEDPA